MWLYFLRTREPFPKATNISPITSYWPRPSHVPAPDQLPKGKWNSQDWHRLLRIIPRAGNKILFLRGRYLDKFEVLLGSKSWGWASDKQTVVTPKHTDWHTHICKHIQPQIITIISLLIIPLKRFTMQKKKVFTCVVAFFLRVESCIFTNWCFFTLGLTDLIYFFPQVRNINCWVIPILSNHSPINGYLGHF